jgi:two-component system chemotaxis sensor kinase CheA
MAQDPYRYFRTEAREIIDQLSQGVLEFESSRPTPELAARLLRLAHTLKGAAGVVKQPEIAASAHEMEDVLVPYREARQPLPPERMARLLSLVDAVADRVAALGTGEPTSAGATVPATTSATVARPLGPGANDAPVTPPRQPHEPVPTMRSDAAEMDELLDAIGAARTLFLPVRRSVAHVERVRVGVGLLAAQLAAPSAQLAAPSAAGGATRRPSGVGAGRARSTAAEVAEELASLGGGLVHTVEQIERELDQIRVLAERLRLAPASTVFTSLRRASRDAAEVQGKRVVFEGHGGDVRLDPQVLSAVYGALLHMVRNAVAHGIEAEPDRRAAGKPAEGRVVVDVARRGRRVAFTCRDDGRGFDLDAVRQAAQTSGLWDTTQASSEELVGLLMRGGISTAGTVSQVSGRGIGLDAVRDVAERLGGEVAVATEAGRGASVELVVPLALLSIEGMAVEIPGVTVVIPLDCVRYTMRLRPEEIIRNASGATVLYNGQAIPFLPLARALAAPATTPRKNTPVVVVAVDTGMVAIGVDRLLGTAEVIVRPLPELAPAGEVVGGVCIDGEGNPRIVVDPDGLVAEVRRLAGATGGHTMDAGPARRPTVLVVDDSLTTRMLEQTILESAGYQVEVAASGEEALDKARRDQYALFLVDIEMPGMNGYAFIEHARADPALRDIPSILVSSRASAEDRQRGELAGARLHVAKSEFDQVELLAQIGKLIG